MVLQKSHKKPVTGFSHYRLLLFSCLLIRSDLHHYFIHFVTHALSCILAPLDTAQGVIVSNEAALLTGHLRINGKHLNFRTALRADLLDNCGCSGFPLASI